MNKKPLSNLQYKIDWNSQTIEPALPVITVNNNNNNKSNDEFDDVNISQFQLERGSINLNNSECNALNKKQTKPVKNKVSDHFYFFKDFNEFISCPYFRYLIFCTINFRGHFYDQNQCNLYQMKMMRNQLRNFILANQRHQSRNLKNM